MRRFGLILGLMLLSDFAAAQSLPCTAPCDTGDQTFTFAGNTRHYRAYFPASISASVPYKVFFYLAGYEQATAWNLPHYDLGEWSMFENWANANGVAIVYVSPLIWDSRSGGQPASSSDPLTQAVRSSFSGQQIWDVNSFDSYLTGSSTFNDAGYLDYLIATATIGNATGHWGAGTVAMVGFSTGGLEAHRFAIAYPSDVVGVGIWAGPLYAETGSSVPVYNAPVDVFIQDGSADPIFNPCGNGIENPATVYYPLLPNMTNVASQDETFNFWATGMNCGSPVPNIPICTAGIPTGGFTGKIAAGCAGGKQVQFTFVIGGGHDGPTYQGMCNFYNFLFPTNPCVPQTTVTLNSSVNPVNVGMPVTLTATVEGGQNATGTVAFMKRNITLGTVPLSNGQAILNSSFGGPGVKPITAVYSGDANFSSGTSPILYQVVGTGNQTTTALVSGTDPSVVGQSVTFTATVSGNGGTPTGTVSLMEGTVTLGTATLAGGQASLNITFGAVSIQFITAVYSGDANFAGSTSFPLVQLVSQASTTTTLVSSPNPSNTGQNVTLSATVVPQFTGSPTGWITFMQNGDDPLGTVPLSGGQAMLIRVFGSVGTKPLSAIYSGDGNFMGSTGTATQNVQ